MTNIEICEELGILGDIRERIGADEEDDTSYDYRIEKMQPNELVAKWAGWNLGDESWGYQIIGFYEAIKKGKEDE